MQIVNEMIGKCIIKWQFGNQRKKKHIYFVPDFYEQEQGKRIVEIFEKFKLLTGGSGVSTFLAEKLEKAIAEGKKVAEDYAAVKRMLMQLRKQIEIELNKK